MLKKMLTLKELSEYLGLSEEKITILVEQKVISAYKIGGELLRFQKEQIDATRAEIESYARKKHSAAKVPLQEQACLCPAEKTDKDKKKEKLKVPVFKTEEETFLDMASDFFYFNDFYLISGLLISILLMIIFKG